MTAGDLFFNMTTPFLGLRLSGNDVHLSIRTTGIRSLTRTPTTIPKHRLTTPVLVLRLLILRLRLLILRQQLLGIISQYYNSLSRATTPYFLRQRLLILRQQLLVYDYDSRSRATTPILGNNSLF